MPRCSAHTLHYIRLVQKTRTAQARDSPRLCRLHSNGTSTRLRIVTIDRPPEVTLQFRVQAHKRGAPHVRTIGTHGSRGGPRAS